MTVTELIKKLSNLDGNLMVGNFEYSCEEGSYFNEFSEIEVTDDGLGNTVVGIF